MGYLISEVAGGSRRHRGEVPQPRAVLAVVLIGLPGSGKSTLAATAPLGTQVVSTDAIRTELYGDAAIQGQWLQVWAQVEARWRAAAAQIRAGTLGAMVYDATNTARKKRRSTIAALEAAGFTRTVGLFLDVPLSVCLARNAARARVVPPNIIEGMHRQLLGGPPTGAAEGFARLERATDAERAAIALRALLENRTPPSASL